MKGTWAETKWATRNILPRNGIDLLATFPTGQCLYTLCCMFSGAALAIDTTIALRTKLRVSSSMAVRRPLTQKS
jgi:hypothetical protein